MKLNNNILISLAFLFALISCVKKDWSKKVEVHLVSSTNFEQGAVLGNNRLEISTAKFYISSLSITGKRLQGDDVDISIDEAMELDLMQGSIIQSLDIPIGTYESLTISFELASNSFMDGDVIKISGNPDVKPIAMLLDFQGQQLDFHLVENINKEVITISEEAKQLKLSFDLQGTLSGVGIGPWNGLITASQLQSNIDVTTIAGENFLFNFKEQLLENSSLKVE